MWWGSCQCGQVQRAALLMHMRRGWLHICALVVERCFIICHAMHVARVFVLVCYCLPRLFIPNRASIGRVEWLLEWWYMSFNAHIHTDAYVHHTRFRENINTAAHSGDPVFSTPFTHATISNRGGSGKEKKRRDNFYFCPRSVVVVVVVRRIGQKPETPVDKFVERSRAHDEAGIIINLSWKSVQPGWWDHIFIAIHSGKVKPGIWSSYERIIIFNLK